MELQSTLMKTTLDVADQIMNDAEAQAQAILAAARKRADALISGSVGIAIKIEATAQTEA